MSETKKTYTLGKIKQLIDLNGDSTNFDLQFKVTCHDDTPFNLLVVDQTTLDNTPELQYKEANKTISGNIIADKNVYQNYFLILKSEKKCTVDVELIKKLLPRTPDVELITENNSSLVTKETQSVGVDWLKIGLITLVVVIGICVLWWLYKKKGEDVNLPEDLGLSPSHISRHSFSHISRHDSNHGSGRGFNHGSGHGSSHGSSHSYSHGYKKPVYKATVSPDVMSHHSFNGGDNGISLLHRLRKFAR